MKEERMQGKRKPRPGGWMGRAALSLPQRQFLLPESREGQVAGCRGPLAKLYSHTPLSLAPPDGGVRKEEGPPRSLGKEMPLYWCWRCSRGVRSIPSSCGVPRSEACPELLTGGRGGEWCLVRPQTALCSWTHSAPLASYTSVSSWRQHVRSVTRPSACAVSAR